MAHKNGEKYWRTRAFHAAKDAITCNQCVLVIGEAGCGKSTTVKYVADSFIQRQPDYMIKIITTFSAIDPDPSQKTLYIFYDAFGVYNCDRSFTDVLEHYRDIELLLKRKHTKLIMTSRSSVYNKLEDFHFSVVVCVIDLNKESFTLLDQERKNIYETICSPTLAEHPKMALKCKHASFPLLCKLFVDFPKLQESPNHLFENPIDAFLQFLNFLKETNILTYRLLVCVAMHGKVDCPLDSEKNSPRTLELALQAFQQDSSITMTNEKIVEKFKEFVKEKRWFKQLKESNFYSFRHKFLHEIVAYHYGQDHVDGLLAAMGSNFISEKIRLDEGMDKNSYELFLFVDVSSLKNRMFHDIRYHVNYLHVFTHNCWKNDSFCNAFRSELQSKDRSDIDDLFWKWQDENISSRSYKVELSKRKGKNYISLKHDDSEWFRHKLLEDRTETVSENKIEYIKKIKAVSWVLGYGIYQILPELLTDQKDAKKMTNMWATDELEKIRFLILTIFSQSLECFHVALNLAGPKNLNKTCSSKDMKRDFRNKHKNFTPLTAACYKGFSGAIKELVKKGSDVNCMDKNGSTPFVLACRFASTSDCVYLIEKKAELRSSAGNGVTPLIAAVMGQNTELVAILLNTHGLEVNQYSSKRKSPLYYAAKKGSLDIAKLLIDKNASINTPDEEERTPLYWASQNGFDGIVEYLIISGANVNQCNKKGKSPLYCASKRGRLNIVKLLLNKGADINKSTLNNKSSLYRSVKRGHFEICEVLIKEGANVNKTDCEGSAPLYWAAKREHIYILNLLLEKNASPNNRNDKGKTALHCAAKAGRIDIATCLVNNGADVDIDDLRKRTPLYCASKHGHVAMVNFLIKRGSDCNKTTIKSKSAVLCASKRNHKNVLQALLSKRPNVNIADNNGVTPLHFAAQLGHLEIARILLQAGADVNSFCTKKETALHWASQAGEYSIVKLLLDNRANVNQTDESGNTALFCASEGNHFKIVKLLVEKRADVKIQNIDHQTPLLSASKGNHLKVVKYLIDRNVDVNVRDIYGQTALLWATEKGYFELVKMLCEKRCNVNDFNGKQQTPVYLAAKFGHIEIVKYLLEKGADKTISDKYDNFPDEIAKKMGYMDIYNILRTQH